MALPKNGGPGADSDVDAAPLEEIDTDSAEEEISAAQVSEPQEEGEEEVGIDETMELLDGLEGIALAVAPAIGGSYVEGGVSLLRNVGEIVDAADNIDEVPHEIYDLDEEERDRLADKALTLAKSILSDG